jgi:hypothetical protein
MRPIMMYVLPGIMTTWSIFFPGALQLVFFFGSLIATSSARILRVPAIRRYLKMEQIVRTPPPPPIKLASKESNQKKGNWVSNAASGFTEWKNTVSAAIADVRGGPDHPHSPEAIRKKAMDRTAAYEKQRKNNHGKKKR